MEYYCCYSKITASSSLLLALNLLFFSLVSSCNTCTTPVPTPATPSPATPSPGAPSAGTPSRGGPSAGTPSRGGPSAGTAPSAGGGRCPRDALKFGVCANVLGLINLNLGRPPRVPCCTLLQGLANLEAAVCLCTALRGNVLGINLNLPINLSLLLNYCGRRTPSGFQCA